MGFNQTVIEKCIFIFLGQGFLAQLYSFFSSFAISSMDAMTACFASTLALAEGYDAVVSYSLKLVVRCGIALILLFYALTKK